MMDNTQLFTITSLHTMAGSSLAVLIVVQAIKNLPWIKMISTRGLAILIGEGLFMLTTSPFPTSMAQWIVFLLNGLMAASTAIGGWHLLSSAKSTILSSSQSQIKK